MLSPPRRWWRATAILLGLALLAGFLLATPLPTASTAPRPWATRTAPVAAPHPSATAIAPATPVPAEPTRIVLHRGDTVWALSRRFHTTITTLAKLNHLADPARIRAGATLLVPAATVGRPHPQDLAAHPITRHPATTTAAAQSVRQAAAAVFGSQYPCAANIITRESGWNPRATNPFSGAYGLGQALPAAKMAVAGPDWRDNPTTQLTWMRDYVTARYGGACAAWTFWQAHRWY